MATAKSKVGTLKCLNPKCGQVGYLRTNAAGTLSFACDHCGLSAFARRGDDAHTDLQAIAKSIKPATPEPPPAKPGAPAAPAAASADTPKKAGYGAYAS